MLGCLCASQQLALHKAPTLPCLRLTLQGQWAAAAVQGVGLHLCKSISCGQVSGQVGVVLQWYFMGGGDCHVASTRGVDS
jgi:hypothetical protein